MGCAREKLGHPPPLQGSFFIKNELVEKDPPDTD
jgi:hypothetical protein